MKPFMLSNGEIHFLWWFIQGSIMSPSTRERLHNAWGMCERHAWGFIAVDAAFRQGYLHGPAILYADLMHRAGAAFPPEGPLNRRRLRRRLGDKSPCLMCELEYGPESTGIARPEIVVKGRDMSELRIIAEGTSPYWQKTVCGHCVANGSLWRCRKHLIKDLAADCWDDMARHADHVRYLAHHMKRYAASFCWGYPDTRTPEDVAALISSVGWCSGWETFFSILK
jgi:hypothetical protein